MIKSELKEIQDVFEKFNIEKNHIIPFGRNIAKLDTELRSSGIQPEKKQNQSHLILVTAMSPTPHGEGKTTTTIGLGDALNRLQKKTLICLRQPSMGPCFGVKGGATGGGKAQLAPMEAINLNFTGDIHAIAAAHNLLSALIDNHIHWGNELRIDIRKIYWRRVVDMNDRALRLIVQSVGGSANGFPREDGFDIAVASEVMAIFCLAKDMQDLQRRLGMIVVAESLDKKTITAKDLKAHGAMAAILKTAILPNMVQTLEGNPALVHGGPFANIAHGCSSVIATKSALDMADYVITEAGFGADLGAEKFLNIKCRQVDAWPSCAVLVATIRAIRHHGDSLQSGICNLARHIENLQKFSLPIVVAINRFTEDSDTDLNWVINYCKTEFNVDCVVNRSWEMGSEGALALGNKVIEICDSKLKTKNPHFLYPLELPISDKIRHIAKELYRAKDISMSDDVIKKIQRLQNLGFNLLPICIAKNQYSFSSDPKKLGAAEDHILSVKDVRLSAGAGFIVVICGDIMTMPGLPRNPSAETIRIDESGSIQGLF